MTDFHDIRFPLHLAFGASGGPVRTTSIVQLANGAEARNVPRRHSRRRYNAVAGIKSQAEAIEILHFFEARNGPLHAFRFRDPLDHVAEDETLGYGDGETTIYRLRKHYGDAVASYARPITKPVAGTIIVLLDAKISSEAQVDAMTGEVVFFTAPAPGTRISASFEFDVPVRFASDSLDLVLDDFGATQIQDIPLIEVLDHV